MTLKFQAPNLPEPKSKTQALADQVAPTLSNLPLLYQQLKQQHIAATTAAQTAADTHRIALAHTGTGLPAPVAQGPADASGVGPVTPPETLGEQVTRQGSLNVDAQAKLLAAQDKANKPDNILYYSPSQKKTFLTKNEASDAMPINAQSAAIHTAINTPGAIIKSNPDGTMEIQYTSPGQKNTVVSEKSPPAAPGASQIANRFETEFNKSYNFLTRIKQNKETLANDRSTKANKLTMGKLHPSAGQGVVGSISRGLGVGTPEQATFATSVGKANDIYRKDITGAAAGFPELTKLESRLPTTEETDANFMAKSDATLNEGINILRKEIQRASAKGIDTSVYEQQLNELEGVAQGGAPAKGTVEGGYKFKGGDPADKNNWEKQ